MYIDMNVYDENPLSEEQTKKYRDILLTTFIAFKKLCEEHHIEFVAAYGTVLGAVRHKGLIPWDDDIDVMMSRKNYDKFLALRNDVSLGKYEIVDDTIKGYYLPFAKFCDATTTLWETRPFEFVIGIFIDVFPLDYVGTSLAYSKLLYDKYCDIFYKFQVFNRSLLLDDIAKPKFFAYTCLCKCMKNTIINKKKKLEEKIKNINGDRFLYYCVTTGFSKSIIDEYIVKDIIWVPFENTTIAIPKDYDSYLKALYGDYMTPPPIEKQKSQHFHYYINLEKRLDIEEVKAEMKLKK